MRLVDGKENEEGIIGWGKGTVQVFEIMNTGVFA
jgi:hypothetical protein